MKVLPGLLYQFLTQLLPHLLLLLHLHVPNRVRDHQPLRRRHHDGHVRDARRESRRRARGGVADLLRIGDAAAGAVRLAPGGAGAAGGQQTQALGLKYSGG